MIEDNRNEEITNEFERVAALLREQNTLTLATTNEEAEAEAAPLFYWVDEDLALYWLSSPQSRHSLAARRLARVAVTVYRSSANWEGICGVQMRGQIKTVAKAERRAELLKKYCERFKLGGIFSLAIRQSVFYVFEPEWIRYIDNSVRFGYKFELVRGAEGWRKKR
jgi:uncharacterized protein YhbP (UPF0306 family)